eukprot:CAMPEP_0115016784 /NCGR_PEP_ID=MMETSP0216-20121206/27681_1 /TAXON_ID=223996 /ORGANISM="Protocruzia adherens, Strain Boccale" /LENGTH=345 /DNA_ID=CAMNT_0002387383 /DNA_START=107 /DNA_END=1144 /DNA_ORIENTATION=+
MGHLGLLKAKLAKLKREVITAGSKGAGGGGGEGFDVSKTGDARVGLIGFPSVGKSTLLTKMTGTFSESADYEFTTLTCVPGVIRYKGAKIQLLDLPGIIEGAKDGKGRGKQVIGVARTCNLILLVLDASKPMTHKRLIEHELEGYGIRLNKKPADIRIRRTERGGLTISRVEESPKLPDELVTSICKEYKINNAEISIKTRSTVDDLIDAIEGNRIYIPCMYVLNMIDRITIEELDLLNQIPNYCMISAFHEWNLEELMEKIWGYLDLIRIYTKPKGQIPDYSQPIVLPRRFSSVGQLCQRIHKTLGDQLKYANVWGLSVKHNPQKVGKDHVLLDEDVIQIVKKI